MVALNWWLVVLTEALSSGETFDANSYLFLIPEGTITNECIISDTLYFSSWKMTWDYRAKKKSSLDWKIVLCFNELALLKIDKDKLLFILSDFLLLSNIIFLWFPVVSSFDGGNRCKQDFLTICWKIHFYSQHHPITRTYLLYRKENSEPLSKSYFLNIFLSQQIQIAWKR